MKGYRLRNQPSVSEYDEPMELAPLYLDDHWLMEASEMAIEAAVEAGKDPIGTFLSNAGEVLVLCKPEPAPVPEPDMVPEPRYLIIPRPTPWSSWP